MMNKKGAEKGIMYLLVIGMLALIVISYKPDILGGGAATAGAGTPATTGCLTSDKTTFTFKSDDLYAAGTDIANTASGWMVMVNSVRKDSAYTSGDSMTLSPGQTVDMYFYDSGTHSDGGMSSANTAHFNFIVPCTGTLDKQFQMIDFGTASSDTATWPSAGSAVILDDTYASIKGATSGISIPVGGSKTIGKFELIYSSKKGYGSPDGKNCIVFMANKTMVKNLALTGTGVADAACKPDAYVIDEGVITAGAQEYYDWEIPVMKSNGALDLGLTIELESDQDAQASAGGDDLTFVIYDQQWFYNGLNGKMELGYEDENNVLIGADIIGENITLA